MQTCPCGSKIAYLECCGRFIERQQIAITPEQLMRSRYTAYTQCKTDYIAATMKSPAADGFDPQIAKQRALQTKWLKLEVLNSSSKQDKGTVEFIAYFISQSKQQTIHEISEFRRDGGYWYYVDGRLLTNHSRNPIKRNELCSCGSGKKYKKCCLGNT